MKVTRERVRQIEANALKQLQKCRKPENFDLVLEDAIEIMKNHGNLSLGNVIAEKLSYNLTQIDENKLMLILSCSPNLVFNKATLGNHSFWSLKDKIDKKQINQVGRFVVGQLREIKKSINIKGVKKIIDASEFAGIFEGKDSEKKLTMFLLINKDLKRSLLGEWGLKNWRSVSERGNKEKAYLVLRKKKKPLHFRKITDHINLYWTSKSLCRKLFTMN